MRSLFESEKRPNERPFFYKPKLISMSIPNKRRRKKDAPSSKVLALPLLHRRVQFEVVQILEVEPLVLAVQLYRALFTALNDSIDVFVDEDPDGNGDELAKR